jgi:hypothetical protein
LARWLDVVRSELVIKVRNVDVDIGRLAVPRHVESVVAGGQAHAPFTRTLQRANSFITKQNFVADPSPLTKINKQENQAYFSTTSIFMS